jgi:hypothetical protein
MRCSRLFTGEAMDAPAHQKPAKKFNIFKREAFKSQQNPINSSKLHG